MGRSTRAILDNTSATVYAVDTWKGSPSEPEMLAAVASQPGDWVFDRFCTTVRDHLGSKLSIMRATSVEAARRLNRERFDMIFIDASHDYENVKADILAWAPLLAPGGLLCGHDFADSAGVQRAVEEVIPTGRLVGAGSIWSA